MVGILVAGTCALGLAGATPIRPVHPASVFDQHPAKVTHHLFFVRPWPSTPHSDIIFR